MRKSAPAGIVISNLRTVDLWRTVRLTGYNLDFVLSVESPEDKKYKERHSLAPAMIVAGSTITGMCDSARWPFCITINGRFMPAVTPESRTSLPHRSWQCAHPERRFARIGSCSFESTRPASVVRHWAGTGVSLLPTLQFASLYLDTPRIVKS